MARLGTLLQERLEPTHFRHNMLLLFFYLSFSPEYLISLFFELSLDKDLSGPDPTVYDLWLLIRQIIEIYKLNLNNNNNNNTNDNTNNNNNNNNTNNIVT